MTETTTTGPQQPVNHRTAALREMEEAIASLQSDTTEMLGWIRLLDTPVLMPGALFLKMWAGIISNLRQQLEKTLN